MTLQTFLLFFVKGLKMAEEHGEELEEPGSDMDSFLGKWPVLWDKKLYRRYLFRNMLSLISRCQGCETSNKVQDMEKLIMGPNNA